MSCLRGVRYRFLVPFLPPLILYLGLSNVLPHSRQLPPASDQAALAGISRSLLRGEGFARPAVYPFYFAFPFCVDLLGNSIAPLPDLERPPFYPVYLAFLFRLFGVGDRTFWWSGLPLFLLSLVLIRRLGDASIGKGAGKWCLLLFGCNSVVIRVFTESRFEALPVLLVLGLSVILHQFEFRITGFRRGAILGLVLGLLYLSYYPGIVLLILALGFFSRSQKRFQPAALWGILAGFGALVLPWGIRNYGITGNPFFSIQSHLEFLNDTPGWGDFSPYRASERIGILSSMLNHPGWYVAKILRNLGRSAWILIRVLSPLGAVLLLSRLPDGKMRGEDTRWKYVVALVVVWISFFAVASKIQPRYLIPALGPVFATVVAPGLRGGRFRYWALVACYGLFVSESTIRGIGHFLSAETKDSMIGYGRVAEVTAADDWIVSDDDTATAWYADRKTCWLPGTEGNLRKVIQLLKPGAVYLKNGLDAPLVAETPLHQSGFDVLDLAYGKHEALLDGGIVWSDPKE